MYLYDNYVTIKHIIRKPPCSLNILYPQMKIISTSKLHNTGYALILKVFFV